MVIVKWVTDIVDLSCTGLHQVWLGDSLLWYSECYS